MKISLDLLHILDTIDRHGSFSAAAVALHRVPSALSHAIAKLEDELDIPLFVREGRKATLNEAGRALLDDGRHLLRAADELERRVQRIAKGWETELRIAIDTIVPVERLYPMLERFYAVGCGTQVRLGREVLGGTWDALATGRADLVIGAPGDTPARDSGIATRHLCNHGQFVFAIAPQHPLAVVQLGRNEPGKLNHGTPGAGSSGHLAAKLLAVKTGAKFTHVPYQGNAQATNDLVGGSLQLGFINLPVALQFVKAGNLKALAVTGTKRTPLLPDVPTVNEALGINDYELVGWFGILVPARTPAEVVNRLNTEINKLFKDRKRSLKAALTQAG